MRLIKSFFDQIFVFKLKSYKDQRGEFMEILRTDEITRIIGIKFQIKQINSSISKKNIFRGLHFQKKHKQHKIIIVNSGSVIDYFVCKNRNSKNYLKSGKITLSDINKYILFVHFDYAHGYLSLENDTKITYFTSDIYDKNSETGINVYEKKINLNLPKKIILSEKDKNLPFL